MDFKRLTLHITENLYLFYLCLVYKVNLITVSK